MKYLAMVFLACVACVGRSAVAAPSALTKMHSSLSGHDGVYRFTDSGPESTVTCYVFRDYYSSVGGISCVRVK